jgi:polyphenol oxidase
LAQSEVMSLHQSRGVDFYSFDNLTPWSELTQASFTRRGGVSQPPFDTLNASFAVGDDPESVAVNHRRMAAALGWPADRGVSVRQVHGRSAIVVGPEHVGARTVLEADVLVTDRPGILLMLRFADCVPVILWDPNRRVVALVHAGWKGTVLGAPAAAVEMLVTRYGSSPSSILAGIGPSIGPCCYEVGEAVVQPASRVFAGAGVLERQASGGVHFDLWGANVETLMRAGVPEERIAVSGLCTRCRSDLFFSHRASGGRSGRFAVVAGIRDE